MTDIVGIGYTVRYAADANSALGGTTYTLKGGGTLEVAPRLSMVEHPE